MIKDLFKRSLKTSASPNANASDASDSSPSRARGQATRGDEVNDLLLILEKVSEKILKHTNDKSEQTLQAFSEF